MTSTFELRTEYERRHKRFKGQREKHHNRVNAISNLRLGVFGLGAGTAAYLSFQDELYMSIGVLIIALAIFIYLVFTHNKQIEHRDKASALEQINADALKRLDHEWSKFSDTGADLVDEEHPYSSDLDVVGKGSLFQMITTAVTPLGRRRLADDLTQQENDIETIYSRQEAVLELAQKHKWRQEFQAMGMLSQGDMDDPEPLLKWGGERLPLYQSKGLKLLIQIMPVVTFSLAISFFIFGATPYYFLLVAVAIQAAILAFNSGVRNQVLATASKFNNSIKSYEKMLALLEREKFKSPYLKKLQVQMLNEKGELSAKQLQELSKIIQSISNRQSSIFMVINLLILWDYRFMFALEKWKVNSGRLLENWLDAIAQIEGLNSLALLQYDNPEWEMPKLNQDEIGIVAENMGHPLLSRQVRVCNDLEIKPPADILLITGSNMSGKSTLLRTIGINLVLAYAGAPVCARKFQCPLLNVYTCMRVSDNLEESTSSFYAELLRIKKIVEASKSEKVFFLLDEIFKGTNSLDRHDGAKMLIKKMKKMGAMGLVSTHDLELGQLEQETNGCVINFHFREYYRGGKIQFDYKLRSGISTTRNAMYLIKMAGID
ncbi:DNA mismatch repair ATPase MutS [Desulfitispora alkaliphila]|uniref:MutS family DNA mismatch repair protein n=1 Tax=Desulfitispora alkaliphila TaxID=622674 RepID=UPI003D204D31